MSTALTIATKFTAIDKFTPVVSKMTGATQNFGNKAVTAFHRAERAERKFRQGIKNSLGIIGQLGVGLSAMAIGQTVVQANLELEKSLASLSAITGVTGDEFKVFESQIDKVAKKQKQFSGDVASAFEVVGSAQPELLKNADGLAAVTDAALTLSKASGDDLAGSAQYLTGVMNQFGLSSEYATEAMNVLAAASVVGDTKISQTSEAFKIAGSEAKMSGLNIQELSGSIATLSKFGYKGAEAGTKLRNILSKMSMGEALPKDALQRLKEAGVDINLISDKTVPYIQRLKELGKISNNTAALTKMFGSENKGVAAILLNNVALLEDNIKGVTGTNSAVDMAAIKSKTLTNRWNELVASFKNSVTATNSQNKAFEVLQNIMGFVADNMEIIIAVTSTLLAAYIAFKGVLVATNIAMNAYNVAVKVVTAAQWLWNAAMSANPIGLIIIGIAALIALIAIVVNKWNEWGAAVSLFMGPLGMVISLIQAFRRNWDMIKKSFAEGGIVQGLKAIGATLLDAILMPLQQVLELIAKIPGMGDVMQPVIDKMQSFRKNLGVNVSTDESRKPLNADATQTQVTRQIIEKNNNSNATLNINDASGKAQLIENNGMNINLSNTLGF